MNFLLASHRNQNNCVVIAGRLCLLWILLYKGTSATLSGSCPPIINNVTSTLRYCRSVFNMTPFCCPEEKFSLFTSLSCYQYLPSYVIPKHRRWLPFYNTLKCDVGIARLLENGSYVIVENASDYDIANESSRIYETFENEKDKKLWRDCHEAALKCCATMLSTPPSTDPTICPRTWDGWQCFPDTPAGGETEADCPDYTYFRSELPACTKRLKKQCKPEGKFWQPFPNKTGEWTNYGLCQVKDSVLLRHYIHIGSYIVSLIALAPAIFIFFIYKQLRVPRITMHKNLFLSIFINGIVFIIFKWLIIIRVLRGDESDIDNSIVVKNSGSCKFLVILTKYTRGTIYMWMFCEGFYLHKLIVAAFAEQKNMMLYYLLGWGFPTIPIIIYSILRAVNINGADSRCWTFPMDAYEWILNGPNLLSLMLNFLFLINIIRVLVTKLRATNTNEPSQYRKAVRATLVLVPLFGLHFFVTIYRPTTGPCQWIEGYFYINYIIDGLQGFLVALIFCYLNGEVLQLLRRSLQRRQLVNGRSPSRFSMATSTTLTDSSSWNSCKGRLNIQELNANNLRKSITD